MKDLFLTADEYLEMGLSYHDGVALQTWALERVGIVLDKRASGGSGIFVATHHGQRALLTARHVIIAAILGGEVSIGAYDRGKAFLKHGTSITFSATCDAALVHAPDDLVVPVCLSRSEWNPETSPDPDVDAHVIAAGFPREWKGEKDLEQRVLKGAGVMLLWTQVIRSGQKEIETLARWGLPSTLRGMSGGPLFTFDRALVGIHQEETRHRGTGELLSLTSTRRTQWSDLYNLTDTVLGPEDLESWPLQWQQRATYKGAPVRVGFEGWFFASPSDPSHLRGGFGRVDKMCILDSDETRRFTINILSNFYLEGDDTTAERDQAFRTHVRSLLREMRFDPL